jgi:hydrogenase maturation protein HypF
LISPDLSTCEECLRELFDPADRRYRYPFINCTNCGPRFTITKDIPYDRPLTTMAPFAMCPDCQREYEDPLDRRFHAQPNACPTCGPQVWWEQGRGANGGANRSVAGAAAIAAAQGAMAAGKIVAVKGLGGFHLACNATDDAALALLRTRKGRVDKPFAIMAADLAAVERVAHLDDDERRLLSSRQRPIVLLRKRDDSPLSELVAPGASHVGVMLPYTPLHQLLLVDSRLKLGDAPVVDEEGRSSPFASRAFLVMTSGNFSDEPIVKDNDEALSKLRDLADGFLLHDRDIYVHCDDSVVRVFRGQELPVRRSRGYAPFPVKLPFVARPILAVGGELKATFCLTRERHAFMSQHIGDMENLETLDAFAGAVDHMQAIFRITPECIACDLHPGYLSTRWAHEQAGGRPVIAVQHHHAHIAAVMAEHGLDGTEPVIGFAFDGTGYGTDGAIWGGEVLIADYGRFARAAHLAYVPLPGGDAAIKRPYRTALAHLQAAGVPWSEGLPPVAAATEVERNVILRQLETGLNAIPTSSVGRLFDAVASLAGVRQRVTYEGQAAVEFEAKATDEAKGERYEFEVLEDRGGELVFGAGPVVRAVAADVLAGVPAGAIASRFHVALADLSLRLGLRLRELHGLNTVALSGGVYQNTTLLRLTVDRLEGAGFRVLWHRLVPPNDGGLALGQAAIAQHMDRGCIG